MSFVERRFRAVMRKTRSEWVEGRNLARQVFVGRHCDGLSSVCAAMCTQLNGNIPLTICSHVAG